MTSNEFIFLAFLYRVFRLQMNASHITSKATQMTLRCGGSHTLFVEGIEIQKFEEYFSQPMLFISLLREDARL